MKKLLFFVSFLLFCMFLLPFTASADVIPPDSHLLSRCVKVVNLQEFPDLILVGYITGPMIKEYEAYQIKNNECLTKGYKFNSLSIYWTTKTKFNAINLKNLQLSDMTLLFENIEVFGGYITNDNPLLKENIEYSIAGFSAEKLVLYISKQTSEYADQNQAVVKVFDNPLKNEKASEAVLTPPPSAITEYISEPTKKGFWYSIVCFLNKLIGKNCQ